MQGQENVAGGPGWATCPQEEMILLGVLEMSGTPQKPKMGNCYIQTSRDVGKTCQKPAENQNIYFFPLMPTRAIESSFDDKGGIWKTRAGSMQGQANAQRWPGWTTFPQERKYSRGIGDAWHPSRAL